jgi:antirestriction protein ArdC
VPWHERQRAAETGGDPEAIPFLKRFTVFNADQCEGLPPEISPPTASAGDDLVLPQVEALIRATGADIRIGGNQAFYVPGADYIQVPPPAAYFEPINWHRTVCHELGHWSGHESRLDRDMTGCHGLPSYAREELVAEMSGAFVCAALSIVPTVRHVDYLASWLDVLREDNRAIIRAASAASKVADYLLAFRDRELGFEEAAAPAMLLRPDLSPPAAATPSPAPPVPRGPQP